MVLTSFGEGFAPLAARPGEQHAVLLYLRPGMMADYSLRKPFARANTSTPEFLTLRFSRQRKKGT